MPRPTRRGFCGLMMHLGVIAYATGRAAGCRPHGGGRSLSGTEAGAPPLLRTFSPATFATLSAVCERLLPRDADPGAIDLGVPKYIDRAVAEPELAPIRSLLLRVLPIIDRESRKRFGEKAFHEAAPTEQDEIIGLWQHGHDGGQAFFPVILSLTLEGAFSDPKYGGNSGGRGFDMIGFRPAPPLSMGMHAHAASPKSL